MTFIQRFAAELRSASASHAARARGSALNLTPHFHSLVLDGVYAGPAHSPGPFLPLPPPETEDVAVPARDRKRLERLCRYVARPPIAIDRLETPSDGRLAYRLKTRWRDGTTHVLMERHELLERLAPLIPPPRAHQVRYHGLLAPCASGRDRVVPRPAASAEAGVVGSAALAGDPAEQLEEANHRACSNEPAPSSAESSQHSTDSDNSSNPNLHADRATTNAADDDAMPSRIDAPSRVPARRTLWADLLQRVFEVDALCCPRCGGRMRVLAAITEVDVARRILACLNMPTRAPPLARSRPGGRTHGWPAHEAPGAAETGASWAAFEFDQSTPAEWDVGA